MEDKHGFGEGLFEFLAGKGFYIVLLLCAGLIATSIWLMASGSRADVEAASGRETGMTHPADTAGEETGDVPAMSGGETKYPRREITIPVMETEDAPVSEIVPEAPEVNTQPAPEQEPGLVRPEKDHFRARHLCKPCRLCLLLQSELHAFLRLLPLQDDRVFQFREPGID